MGRSILQQERYAIFQKTEKERHEIFLKLLEALYINVDFTFGREKGKQSTALICTYGDVALYQAKPQKGYEGIKE